MNVLKSWKDRVFMWDVKELYLLKKSGDYMYTHLAGVHHEILERNNYDNSRNAFLGLHSGMKLDLS